MRVETGRALSVYGDGGWGGAVRAARVGGSSVSDELLDALARVVEGWAPDPAPEWVTCVPSTSPVVADAAARLAERLGLPFHDVLTRTAKEKLAQSVMENSAQQVGNVHRAFKVQAYVPETPVLLLDDLVDTRWTLTMAGMMLRVAGCPAVHPILLATAKGD